MMIKLPGYIKDYYFLNSYVKFENAKKLPLTLSSRTVSYQMFSDFDKMLDANKTEIGGANPATLYVAYNRALKSDAYRLEITKAKKIKVEASSRRGVRYALNLLTDLIVLKNNACYMPIIQIDDEPSFKYRGIIEGFYGVPWTQEERLDEVDLMNRYRLNTYMYAPKDDEYHRKLWSKLYPETELNQLLAIKDKCSQYDIDFVYCISPGNDFDYSSEEHFSLLFRKLDQVIEHGVKHFGVLMDDIDYKLSPKNKDRFNRPGVAHAYIVNRVNAYLKEKLFAHTLIMCPTEYHQNKDSIYRNDLATYMDKNVAVFYTGDAVCAEVIDEQTVSDVKNYFGHPLFIWENHPVNDFLPTRIFTGPIQNRARKMGNYVEGYITNPMNQWLASRVGIVSCAYYAWNAEGYDPEKAYLEILEKEFPDLMPELKVFFDANRATVVDHFDNYRFAQWVEEDNNEAILDYYQTLEKAVHALSAKENHPLIKEIKPWLNWALTESALVKDIINNKNAGKNLTEKLQEKYRLGSECLDYLLKKKNLLTEEEYQQSVKAKRGNLWWRVWEDKR
jgi:hyaluronoglucosaminidase